MRKIKPRRRNNEMVNKLINPKMVLIPKRRLKDFGKKIRDWNRWERRRYDIYYSPSSVFFDEYPDFPDVCFLMFDKFQKRVVTLGEYVRRFGQGMCEYYDDKLVEETECVENFKDYLVKKYREQNLN
jgi:hypothetical protein